MIHIACQKCRKKFRVGDRNVGKKAKCPGCGSIISISVTEAASPSDLRSGSDDADEYGDSDDLSSLLPTDDQVEQSSDDSWDVEDYPSPRKRNSKSARPSKTKKSRSPLLYAAIGTGVVVIVLVSVGATLWLSGAFSKPPEQMVGKAEENSAPKVGQHEKTSAEWIAEGSESLEDGDKEAALFAYSKAIDVDNRSAPAFNGRGVAYLRSEKLKAALADFTKAIELKSDEAKFYANRALVYEDQGNYGLALADLSKAIKLEPQSPKWYRQRALVFSLMDDTDHEKSDVARAETLDKGLQKDDRPIADKPQRPAQQNTAPLDLANAQILQAPDYDKKKVESLSPFSSEMRKLVSDEFIFKDFQRQIFRSRFDQRTLKHSPLIKLTYGRNTIASPPKYDFDSKTVSLGLLLFYEHWERRQSAGQWFPEDTDRCAIVTEFELDEVTARKWRDAFNRGNLVLDIWYSPLRALSASWKDSPTYTDDRLSHDIVIEVKTLRCEMIE